MTQHPLLYLTICSTRNRVLTRLRRLREPRYLLASLIGIAYFGFLIFGRGRTSTGAFSNAKLGVQIGATLMLFVGAAVAWISPRSSRPALPFSRAEVQHLFPAPISRRRLVRYRVLRSQIGAVVVGAIITVLFRPGSFLDSLMMGGGLAIVLATINLHLTGVSLSRARGVARGWALRALALGAVVIVGATVAEHWTTLITIVEQRGNLLTELTRLTTTGAAGVVLWPFRALANVALAESFRAFLAALPFAVALLVLNYIWVLRTDTPFEEASAELAVKLDDLRRRGPKALRPSRPVKKTPFRLSPQGRPETAVLWKNLISMSRVHSITLLFRVLFVVAFLAMFAAQRGRNTATLLTALCMLIAVLTLVIGPQIARSDLRQDLPALAVLKTWPVRGAALVRGEILAPAITLIAIASLALIGAAIASTGATFETIPMNRWSWLVAALLIAPGVVITHLLAQNGLAVMYPSWVSVGNQRGGIDAIGNQLLVMIAVVLALVVALLPAAIVAAIGTGLLYLITGTAWVVVAGALAGATLLVEAFVASEIVGAILDRSDISVLDAQES